VRSFEDFIKVDIYTGDSDPVYWAIAKAREEWGNPWASRFCVGMLAYYHMGVAIEAAEKTGEAFWSHLRDIYSSAPRGSERRHFRGEGGLKTLESMRGPADSQYEPSAWFASFPQTYAGVKAFCERRLYAFGPYFQLKVCDYMGCLGVPMRSFDGLARNLPTEPAKALALIGGTFQDLCTRVDKLNILAPPYFDRFAGPAEVETSLCGWKTTKFKGNWFGADIAEKRHQLMGCGEKGKQMAEWLPPAVDRNLFKLEL
jgi:hypothetical protein